MGSTNIFWVCKNILLETHKYAHTTCMHTHMHTTFPTTGYNTIFQSDAKTPEQSCFRFRIAPDDPWMLPIERPIIVSIATDHHRRTFTVDKDICTKRYFKKYNKGNKGKGVVSYSRNPGKMSSLLYQGSFLPMRSDNGDTKFTSRKLVSLLCVPKP